MTDEEVERAIEFLLIKEARLDEQLEKLANENRVLAETVSGMATEVRRVTTGLEGVVHQVDGLAQQVDSVIQEMRDGFNHLIVANEVTRKLTEEVATLAVQTSKRVTILESRQQ